MMSDFAGGASGFPMTFFGGRYTDSWKTDFIKTERKKLLQYKASIVKDVAPKLYIPFAGYFVEAHPSDEYLKEMNLKNDPNDLCNLINKQCEEGVSTWAPLPGYSVDLGLLLERKDFIKKPPPNLPPKVFKTEWNFEKAEKRLRKYINHDVFATENWPEFYFNWAGFSEYNLVLKIIETDEDFSPLRGKTNRDIIVDFVGKKPKVLNKMPNMEGRNYLEVKVRSASFRHTIVSGDLWDGLYIGFQCHIARLVFCILEDKLQAEKFKYKHCIGDTIITIPKIPNNSNNRRPLTSRIFPVQTVLATAASSNFEGQE